jgi:hypothetical protein
VFVVLRLEDWPRRATARDTGLLLGSVDTGMPDRSYHAAVDGNIDASDKARLVRKQEGHHRGDLLRMTFATQRGLGDQEFIRGACCGLLSAHRRIDDPGRSRTDANTTGTESDRFALNQTRKCLTLPYKVSYT